MKMPVFEAIASEMKEQGEYRFGPCGSFWNRFALSEWTWAMAICKFHEHWSIHFFCFWLTLWEATVPPYEMMESWGWFYDPDLSYMRLTWGRRGKFIYMPWSWDHCRTEVMLEDGSFVPYERFKVAKGSPHPSILETPEPPSRYCAVFPYRYVRDSGEIQDRIATVTGERRTWCWKARPFRWLRWPAKRSTSILVEFSVEVGEGTGSWKGGVMGCGWDLRPDETPEQCLRRMESERRFTR